MTDQPRLLGFRQAWKELYKHGPFVLLDYPFDKATASAYAETESSLCIDEGIAVSRDSIQVQERLGLRELLER